MGIACMKYLDKRYKQENEERRKTSSKEEKKEK